MEEYMYDYLCKHRDGIESTLVYLPVFWTNLQNHPGFATMKEKYNMLLQSMLKTMPSTTKYFTIVQHDDGPQLQLPKGTMVFGACTGTIPLPLIYEDSTQRLENTARLLKKSLASFVGSYTHPVRKELFQALSIKPDVHWHGNDTWTPRVAEQDAADFLDKTLQSKFCLAPRGYGRSSFRFFEAMQLDTIPIYVWDDIEWLPYKDKLDYSTFSISINKKYIGNLYSMLQSISEEKYGSMVKKLKEVKSYFTLEGMAEYIVQRITPKVDQVHATCPA